MLKYVHANKNPSAYIMKLAFLTLLLLLHGVVMADAAVDIIRKHEGFSPSPYICPGGQTTIGYGFTDVSLVSRGVITRDEADRVLVEKVDDLRRKLRLAIRGRRLSCCQESAIVSFVYNIGWSRFARSSVLMMLRRGDSASSVAAELLKWRKVDTPKGMKDSVGLYIRRKAEARLFMKEEKRKGNSNGRGKIRRQGKRRQ